VCEVIFSPINPSLSAAPVIIYGTDEQLI